ncbi:MFS transporter [Mycolicibacterium confluentis]|uniref:MFS transporter n=1 Tax=Mycolicibacterium confluentis TaxID=28047 RepID=A0A7I7Y299_9MYCO|nr:MFS transporter [Mycolicibacterium confluentis]MCV7320257.1 MFS transporter [Mycolicibacterium confluentis]ORV34774.1 MFS transporter [Mycolicibacterium confluentis]BBZ35293.1 MFS transporter [Mycolicibacterium confluentis]
MSSASADATTGSQDQRWAYALLLVLSGVALGVSGMPAPLYGIYETTWHLSPLATTIVFGVYAFAALAAVLVSGRISDVVGRKPVLLGALVALIVGLVLFLLAQNIVLLLIARAIHGAAVGSIVVAAAAALLDLRPDHGMRSGQLSGVAFNIGMTVAIVVSAGLAQYAPHPLRTPYAAVAVVCAVVGAGVLALRETHTSRAAGPIRISKPAVAPEIRQDFWFAALGAMASWSVLGVLLSLYPSLAAHQAHIDNLLFAGGVVGTTAFAAALAQMAATRVPAHLAAIFGDIGMAVALLVTIPVLVLQSWQLVFVAAALLGATFGLGFGGSLRHLSKVVPTDQRGETMSAFYVLAYSAMAVPTIIAGWAATRWTLATVFPWFAALTALACVAAAVVGAVTMRKQASR